MSERNDLYGNATAQEAVVALCRVAVDAVRAEGGHVLPFDEIIPSEMHLVRADVLAVARVLLDNPWKWLSALGWEHTWNDDNFPQQYVCTRCGVHRSWPEVSVCPRTQEVKA